MTTKTDLWEEWLTETLVADIRASERPDPVPMLETSETTLETTNEFDEYRYGRGNGEYLYLLYLLDRPFETARDVVPVYVGETNTITSRLHQHFKQIRDSLPVESWEDDGSWGSWSKYDHVVGAYAHAESPLYAWILDLEEYGTCPYGYDTYRQELEAKLVGLIHSHPRFERVFANREFVPNRVAYEIGNVGPRWLDGGAEQYDPTVIPGTPRRELHGASKADLWEEWVDQTIARQIRGSKSPDPIPLFETDDSLTVQLTDRGGLQRSETIDEQIRQEGLKCVDEGGVLPGTPNGLLYVMYQLDTSDGTVSPSDVVPRYIGKAEAYGKKNELSANFVEIAHERTGTRSFGRWGDGDYWHVGELSNTIFGRESKKTVWASELFEPGSRTLKQQLYLWIRAWDPERHPGPYRYDAYLAEAEPLLIGLAYDAYPEKLLNHSGVSDESPVKSREYHFEPIAE